MNFTYFTAGLRVYHYLIYFTTFNTMKHSLFFMLLLLGFMSLRAQDTIYKRSGEVIPAKITEISTAEVKYKRFSMPDGPVFIIGRSEVQKIRFSNGVVDSFAVSPPVTTQTVMPAGVPVIVQQQPAPVLSGLIENPRAGLYYYNGAKINEKKMLYIAADKNRTWRSKELDQAILATGDFKKNQYISGFGGPAVLLACVIAAGQTSQNNANANVAGALVFNGLGIFVASQIISPMFKRKRTQSARRVVTLFNEQVQKHQPLQN